MSYIILRFKLIILFNIKDAHSLNYLMFETHKFKKYVCVGGGDVKESEEARII